jgi:hypothetical protein
MFIFGRFREPTSYNVNRESLSTKIIWRIMVYIHTHCTGIFLFVVTVLTCLIDKDGIELCESRWTLRGKNLNELMNKLMHITTLTCCRNRKLNTHTLEHIRFHPHIHFTIINLSLFRYVFIYSILCKRLLCIYIFCVYFPFSSFT